MFNKKDYDLIYSIVFQINYPGYKPDIGEAPNRDGVIDTEKRYAHISVKYLEKYKEYPSFSILNDYLWRGHILAQKVANELKLPEEFRPDITRSALRILEYPPGATATGHHDFNLFTLSLYRDQLDRFRYIGEEPPPRIRAINEQIHFGDLMNELGIAKASKHEVLASDTTQHSIVYFTLPKWEAVLPNGETVGKWLDRNVHLARYKIK